MKVLFVSEYFYPIGKGGGEISTFLLAKELVKCGIKIHVLTSWFDGMKKEELIDGVNIHRRLRSGKNPNKILDNIKRVLFFERSLLTELEKLDKKENFDIIHCMNATSISAVKLKSKLKKRFFLHANSPVMFCPKGTLMYKDKRECDVKCSRSAFLECYIHSNLIGKIDPKFYEKYNPLFVFMYRKRYEDYQSLIKKFDHYIAISKFMKRMLVKSGVNEKKVSVVYPLIEFERFSKLKKPKNEVKKILYLGEYSKPKGPQVLIDALKQVKTPYEANFYGEGSLKNCLIKEAKKFNLNVNINGKADYDDIPKIMEKHDIVVVPSLVAEGFGRVALEATVAGKVVIGTGFGGLGECPSIKKLKKTLFKKILNNRISSKNKIHSMFTKREIINRINLIYKD
jgi:glycosyltransferase involved in cell wall biosynthesis